MAARTGISGPTGPNTDEAPNFTSRWPHHHFAGGRHSPSFGPFVPGDDDRGHAVDDDLGMGGLRASDRGDPGARGEGPAIALSTHRRARLQDCPRQRPSATPDGLARCSPRLSAGPSSGQPLMAQVVFAHPDRRQNDRPPSRRDDERDITDVSRVDVPPRGVYRLTGADRQRGLAAIADSAVNSRSAGGVPLPVA